MARFRATIKGSRGDASRLGDAASGLSVNINGWNVGVRVVASADGAVDVFDVWLTGGSNHAAPDRYLGRFREDFDTLGLIPPGVTLGGARANDEPAPPPEGRVMDARANEPPAPARRAAPIPRDIAGPRPQGGSASKADAKGTPS